MTALRIGLLGAGFIARMYAAALDDEPLAKLALVADPDPAAIDGCAIDCPRGDPEALFEDPRIDCVCVLTPHGLHADQVERALDAGKHVVCEKPLAGDVERAEQLVRAARDRGRHLIVRHYLRGAPFTAAVRDAIASGAVGRVHSAAIEYATNQIEALERPGQWRGTWGLGAGGALMDLGVHGIDVLRELLDVAAVEACAYDDSRTRGVRADDSAAVILRLRDGGLARVFVTCRDASTSAPRWRWELLGDRGRVEVSGDWKRADVRLVSSDGCSERGWNGWWDVVNRTSVRAAVRTIALEPADGDSGERAVATLRLVRRAYELGGAAAGSPIRRPSVTPG